MLYTISCVLSSGVLPRHKIQAALNSKGEYVAQFGPARQDTVFIESEKRPSVSLQRSIDPVWTSTFEAAGWSQAPRTAESFNLKHQMEPQNKQEFFWNQLTDGQVISQVPGWIQFGKATLLRHSRRLAEAFPGRGYDFAPFGFSTHNATENALLKQYMEQNPGKWMIQKGIFGTKGQGIQIVHSYGEINQSKRSVVQEYLDDPVLFNGYKFDLRVYVLITSLDPLIAYVYNDGYSKLASRKYERPSAGNVLQRDMHLTNRDPNVGNYRNGCEIEPGFEGFQSINQTFDWLYAHRAEEFTDPSLLNAEMTKDEFREELHARLQQTMQRVLVAMYKPVMEEAAKFGGFVYMTPRRFYARHGADVMMTRDGRFLVLEVNRRPYQATMCPIEHKIAPAVVQEELNLVGIPLRTGASGIIVPQIHTAPRIESVNKNNPAYFQACLDQLRDEASRAVNFRRIFPTADELLAQELDEQLKGSQNAALHSWARREKGSEPKSEL